MTVIMDSCISPCIFSDLALFTLPLCCSKCTHEGFICLLGEWNLLSFCKAAFYL